MTPEQRAEIAARHVGIVYDFGRRDTTTGKCPCGADWPCDTKVALDALAEAEQQRDRALDAAEGWEARYREQVAVLDEAYVKVAAETAAAMRHAINRAARGPRP